MKILIRLTRNLPIRAILAVVVIALLLPAALYAAACSTMGAQNTVVLLVTFPGVTLPSTVTPQNLGDGFFGTSTGRSLDGFLQEASYGQAWATGSVVGPYTLTGTYSCSDVTGAITHDAIAAAVADGVDFNSYTRIFVAFPDIFGCGWAGFAGGGCTTNTNIGLLNASMSYLVTGYLTSRDGI